jgi:ankyrin repeat protein
MKSLKQTMAVLCAASGLCMASVCSAQVNNARDGNEWSGFGTPAVEPDRTGPVSDQRFLSLKQSGPWQPQAVGDMSSAEAQLMALARQGRWADAVAWLKQTSPDPNVRDELGATPLSLAASAGGATLVTELLRRGADPDRVGAAGMTPLAAAAFHGHELVVRELLRKGARTDVPNATGQWPLHLACASGHQRIVKMLMEAGADVRAFNREGRHALAEAAFFGQVGVMRQLVDAKVPPDLLDLYGRNALHAAALGQQQEAVAWLRQQGVKPTSALTEVLLSQSD